MNSKISIKIKELQEQNKISDFEYVQLFCLNSMCTRLNVISNNLSGIRSDLHDLINKKITERKK